MSAVSENTLPDIVLSDTDYDTLDRLVGEQPTSPVARLLRRELDRAEVRQGADMPHDTVALNRWLHYADTRSDGLRRVQLVLPAEADIDQGRVSVLSFVGAGLIGLKEGDGIDWPDPSGAQRRLVPVLIEDLDPLEPGAH